MSATNIIATKTAKVPTFCGAARRNGNNFINNSFPFIINISCQINSTLSKHPGKNNCLWLPPLLLMAGRFRSRWSLTCEQYQIGITRGSFTSHSSDTWLVIYVCQLLSDVMSFCICSVKFLCLLWELRHAWPRNVRDFETWRKIYAWTFLFGVQFSLKLPKLCRKQRNSIKRVTVTYSLDEHEISTFRACVIIWLFLNNVLDVQFEICL